MATKTPSKGKKAAASPAKGKASAPKKAASKPAPVEPKDELDEDELPEVEDIVGEADVEDDERDEDVDDDDEEEAGGEKKEKDKAAAKPAAAAAKKPAAKPAARGALTGDDAPQVVPARRLTPEAKAKINELVAKGMPLQDALRAAAAWETFVAPVREEPAKLVQGRSFDGGGHGGHGHGHGHPRQTPRPTAEEREEDEEPVGGGTEED